VPKGFEGKMESKEERDQNVWKQVHLIICKRERFQVENWEGASNPNVWSMCISRPKPGGG